VNKDDYLNGTAFLNRICPMKRCFLSTYYGDFTVS